MKSIGKDMIYEANDLRIQTNKKKLQYRIPSGGEYSPEHCPHVSLVPSKQGINDCRFKMDEGRDVVHLGSK